MSGFWSLRRLTTAAILVTATWGAVSLFGQAAPTAAPAMPPGGAMPAPGDPIALINGRAINNKAFNDIMMQVSGMRVFQQVFDLTLVQGACQEAEIPLEGDSFKNRLNAELEKTMQSLGIVSTSDKPLTQDQRTQALGIVLQQQGVTAVEFRLGLETRAGLRALSIGKTADPTEEDIQEAYQSEYGEKRKIHIMTYPDGTAVSAIREALATKSPEDVAKSMKLNAPAVWIISKNAKGIDEIRKVAFDVLKQNGAVSAEQLVPVPGQTGQTQKVLIKLDEITPDRTADFKYPTVKDDLKNKLIDFRQSNWMQNRLAVMRKNAVVDIKDPILKDQFQQIADAMTRAADTAKTQPGGAITGTAPATMSLRPATRP